MFARYQQNTWYSFSFSLLALTCLLEFSNSAYEITKIFALNLALARKSIDKAKKLVAIPALHDEQTWLFRCLISRESIFAHFSSLETTTAKPLPNPTKLGINSTQVQQNANTKISNTVPNKPTNTSTILLLGSLGAGKSSVCNFLHNLGEGKRMFTEAEPGQFNLVTEKVTKIAVDIKNSLHFNGSKFVLIDTPGLNATEDIEKQFHYGLYQALQSGHGINVVALVVPFPYTPDIQWINTMIYCRKTLAPLFAAKQVCVVLTFIREEDFSKMEDLPGGFEYATKNILEDINAKLGILFCVWFC